MLAIDNHGSTTEAQVDKALSSDKVFLPFMADRGAAGGNRGAPPAAGFPGGASLNHGQLSAAREPPRENHMPGRHEARLLQAYAGDKSQLRVIPAENSTSVEHEVWLVRDFDDSKHSDVKAYGRMPGKDPIDIGGAKNRHPEWGEIYFCIVYERIGSRTFQAPPAPPPGQPMRPQDCVAVKRLKKSVVQNYLARGGQENPYREAARMQQIGDNKHVLKCIEFLQDGEYLYIVMPKAAGRVGTLKDEIWEDEYNGIVLFDPDELMEHDRVRQIFNKVLKILKYLEEHSICHRDLSPDNFLFLTDDNLVVFDLAMSIRIPVDDNGQRSLITPQGRCGTIAVMASEIYKMQVFDGVAIDLWSVSVLLYCLLTNNLLYYKPIDDDKCFRFFVTNRHLSNSVNATRVRQMAIERLRPDHGLSVHARMQTNMRPEILALLENLLAPNPAHRFSLAETINETERLCQAGLFP